jgi:hypothetical protein
MNHVRGTRPRPNNSNNNNENWKKAGSPRRLNIKLFTLPVISRGTTCYYENYVNGQIYYLVKRPAGRVMLYSPQAFMQLIRSGPYNRSVRTTNHINDFLTHAKLNTILFNNVRTRLPVYPKLVRKVRVRRPTTAPSRWNVKRAMNTVRKALARRRTR